MSFKDFLHSTFCWQSRLNFELETFRIIKKQQAIFFFKEHFCAQIIAELDKEAKITYHDLNYFFFVNNAPNR
jgi:hypothetical protein